MQNIQANKILKNSHDKFIEIIKEIWGAYKEYRTVSMQSDIQITSSKYDKFSKEYIKEASYEFTEQNIRNKELKNAKNNLIKKINKLLDFIFPEGWKDELCN